MRFDDMIATVLGQDAQDVAARAIAWRQLVDLAAQARDRADVPLSEALYKRLDAWRGDVLEAQRLAAARSLAGRRLSPRLVQFFADDRASVAAPLLTSVRLSESEWLDLLPRLTPTARSLVRHRRDLPRAAEQALASFGATDMMIAACDTLSSQGETPQSRLSQEVPVAAEEGVSVPAPLPVPMPEDEEIVAPITVPQAPVQISELVARIERFRREQSARRSEAPSLAADADVVQRFAFETGPDGTLTWVEDVPRGPLIGLSIALAAMPGLAGVDGQVAGAFRQRTAFRDARLTVGGEGPAAGAWRVSAVPCFDPVSGRFEGYRGSARRPRGDEDAAPQPDYGLGAGLTPDSLRQLAHELKTPLNAVIGFGEMIQGQVMGPVASSYRDRATTIVGEAQRVLGAVEDLDIAARLESGVLAIDPEATDGGAILIRVVRALGALTDARGVHLAVTVPPGLPMLALERRTAERMLQRLFAAAVGLSGEGEQIAITASAAAGHLHVSVDRPQALGGLNERELLDPGYSLAGDWPDAPMLGLGFSLRLVRSLAEAARGRLDVELDRFSLILPAAAGGVEGNEGRI